MDFIEKYYNKFNEDKRLLSRHGIVEFTISLEYINKHLNSTKPQKVLDVGAGTGRYSNALHKMGHTVTAIEYVKKNLCVLKENYPQIKAYQGSALNLSRFNDESFDAVILFGPLYHLFGFENKLKALTEAKRVTKKGGLIFVAYLLNNYAIIRHGFMDKNIITSIQNKKVDQNFNINTSPEDLYSYVNLEDIQTLNASAKLKRVEIISPDGPTDYIRPYINNLSSEEFELYIDFVRKNSANPNQIGASSHIVDILTKE